MCGNHPAGEPAGGYSRQRGRQQERPGSLPTEPAYPFEHLIGVVPVEPLRRTTNPVPGRAHRIDRGTLCVVGLRVVSHRRQLLPKIVQSLHRGGSLGLGLLPQLRAGLAQKVAGPFLGFTGNLSGSLLSGTCDIDCGLLAVTRNVCGSVLGLPCRRLLKATARRTLSTSRG